MPKRDRSEARRNLIRTYRDFASSNDRISDEMRERADGLELQELGHECGHIFTITAFSTMHSGLAGEGPESHRDSPPDPRAPVLTLQVRANSLTEACRKAAATVLSEWEFITDPLDGDRGAGAPA